MTEHGEWEVEFKFALREEADFEALQEALLARGAAAAAPVRQVNHFLDTPDRALAAAAIALRVREEAGRWLLTLKGPAAGTSEEVTERPEVQLSIDEDAARTLLTVGTGAFDVFGAAGRGEHALVRRARSIAGDGELRVTGSFENRRTRLTGMTADTPSGPIDLCFELDRTLFPGDRIEHEAEVEVPDASAAEAVREALHQLLQAACIEWSIATSKAERLFRYLDEAHA